jgi:GNAT superfamily N-acetyltransferase
MDITVRSFKGSQIAPHIEQIARFRIEGFRSFPYLYEGSTAYEKKYLAGYEREPESLLVCAYNGAELCAVATSLPLCSGSDIVADAAGLFRTSGHRPEEFYYYSEIIVHPAVRGRGIARDIYRVREQHARSLGLPRLCLAVVQRSADHPLRPAGYVPPERIWQRDGFLPTDMTFTYQWPTIQADGSVRNDDNVMRYWIRELSRSDGPA